MATIEIPRRIRKNAAERGNERRLAWPIKFKAKKYPEIVRGRDKPRKYFTWNIYLT